MRASAQPLIRDLSQALAGIAYIASCNTIPHPTNQIDIAAVLSEGIRPHLEG